MPEEDVSQGLFIKPPWIHRTAFLDRMVGLTAKVYPGEGLSAVLLSLNAFLLLGVFFLLKTMREALILQDGGAEVRSYAAALQSLILIFSVIAYGAIASRLDRVRLVNSINTFAILNLAAFAWFAAQGVAIAVPFYLWLGIFNLLVIAQFWGFASDVYSEEQGKRLFPVIGLGGIAGSLAGAWAGGALIGPWGIPSLLFTAAGLLVFSLGLTFLVSKYVCDCGGPQAVIASLPIGKEGGFSVLLSSRYLLLVAVLTLVVNLSSTSGDFLLSKVVAEEASASTGSAGRVQWIGQYYSRYFFLGGLLAFMLQLFAGSRLLAWQGITRTLFVLPLFSLLSYAAILIFDQPNWLPVIRLLSAAIDSSVQTVASHALFLGTSRAAKYKAKAAIDAFFWRTGDLVHAGVVWVGAAGGFGIRHYSWLNLVVVLVWIGVVILLDREANASKTRTRRWRVAEV